MGVRVFITGLGVISPLGRGREAVAAALSRGGRGIGQPRLLGPLQADQLPVGEISSFVTFGPLPRTHEMALLAARDAMAGRSEPPDAIVLGVATGGMPDTERLLRQNAIDPFLYRFHGIGSVAACVAREVGCRGPALTVSNACSSGSAALAVALEMLRSGEARSVLAGGADALCRLTYYGFHALQLVDAAGARPLDRDRRGMTVGEGAALLHLTAAETPPEGALGELLGAGLSCDAYHPATPHPDGRGALQAMQRALADAGAHPSEIDYVNLHGTGTIDNDRSEARALTALFGPEMPPLSSTKGATGHALGAAGAIGAVIAAIAIGEGLIPANSGCDEPDPELGLHPVLRPLRKPVGKAMVNAFGFGGNNACVVIGASGRGSSGFEPKKTIPLSIHGTACLTGAGDAEATMDRLFAGLSAKGIADAEALARHLPPREFRRMKRLQRLVLTLAYTACAGESEIPRPDGVFFGTGWGALSETHDFLKKLFDSEERFTSPIDFIGSVHNAAAGQAALRFGATGPNMTLSGGDYSFEQALMTAGLISPGHEASVLVIGADEHHPILSPLFDPPVHEDAPADGGAAFFLSRAAGGKGTMATRFFAYGHQNAVAIPSLIDRLGGRGGIAGRYGAVFAGLPAACARDARRQLDEFLAGSGFEGPVADYRRWTGEFASASAVAALMAARCIQRGEIPGKTVGRAVQSLQGQGILLLGLGEFITAVEVMP